MDRKKFFDGVRHSPFNGKLTKGQVDGMNAIIDEYERRKWTELRWLAYMLATTKWETDHTMRPITEKGSQKYLKSKKYYPWIGRGYVQLTWKKNYQTMSDLLGVDLIADPNLALDPKIAAQIMFEGMLRGTFTGKALRHYFNEATTDWLNARRIINGTDKASEIAAIAKQFYADLVAAR